VQGEKEMILPSGSEIFIEKVQPSEEAKSNIL